MNPPPCLGPRAVLSLAFTCLIALHVAPAAGQSDVLFLDATGLPLSVGATGATARGISERGWEPLTIVGTVENTQSNASCWIRVSTQWSAHVLPGLDPDGESRANAVDHVTIGPGEWTLVVGAAVDGNGAQRPVRWEHVTNMSWTVHPLLTLSGGNGEAYGLFLPDGTPVRALVCGWADETPPMAATGDATSGATNLRVPVIWETTTTAGERIMRPTYGTGLEAHVNDIASSGAGAFVAVGGGQNSVGQWMPQLWTSLDDGETWSNEAMPLPLGVASGEALDCDHEVGHMLGAGWGQSTAGLTVPLVWDLDTSVPAGVWVVHELPLPTSDEGGQNAYIHKRPGRLKYSNIVLKGGLNAEMGLWLDDAIGGGWTWYGPADYLLNPEIGTPVAPAGIDALGRIAVTIAPPPPTGASITAAQAGTIAGVLIPSPATGIDDGRSTPRLIAVSASPNPFNPGVRIGYTLPRDGRVTVTIHDVTGRVVAHLDEGRAPAGEERVVRWNGTARNGERAASGVYFVRVATPHEIATVKVVKVE